MRSAIRHRLSAGYAFGLPALRTGKVCAKDNSSRDGTVKRSQLLAMLDSPQCRPIQNGGYATTLLGCLKAGKCAIRSAVRNPYVRLRFVISGFRDRELRAAITSIFRDSGRLHRATSHLAGVLIFHIVCLASLGQ
jgi:hypothetical protein